MSPMSWQRRLRKLIDQLLNGEQFRLLCADLEIDYDNLSGEIKERKIQSLIDLCSRQQKLDQLCTLLRDEVPARESEIREIQRMIYQKPTQPNTDLPSDTFASSVPVPPLSARLQAIHLNPPQQQLLLQMAESARAVQDQHQFEVWITRGTSKTYVDLDHPGLGERGVQIHLSNMEILVREELVLRTIDNDSHWSVDITPLGFAYYDFIRGVWSDKDKREMVLTYRRRGESWCVLDGARLKVIPCGTQDSPHEIMVTCPQCGQSFFSGPYDKHSPER